MAKVDIESAFRLLPFHPQDFCLLGFQFEGGFYLDQVLPMGLSISCFAFEQFSSMLKWGVCFNSGLDSTAHYLNDLLFMSSADSSHCTDLLLVFTALCEELGVPLAHTKTEGPSTRLTFLVIKLD